jgi:O-antigen/teichoic acid export membrane protein
LNLTKSLASGFLWTFIETFVLKGVSIIASILMARILGPEEIGVFGMTSIFLAIGLSLVDSGMSSSLIRTKNINDKDYSSVFFLNILIGILVYSVTFFFSPFIADFFNQKILTDLIRVYGLVFIISAFSSVQLAIITKELRFKSIMKLNLPGTIIGSFVGVICAYKGFGVWSLVIMYLLIQLITTFLLWVSSNWRPKFYYSPSVAKTHFKFGYKLTISGILNAFFSNIYNVIIGKVFPVQTLGFFDRARLFNDLPVQTLTGIIDRVSFPLISSIQDDRTKVSDVSKSILIITFFIIAPIMLGAAALAKPLFLVVLGQKWIDAVPFFQILCLSGIFYPIHAFNINLLKVFGRSDLFLKLEITKVILVSISVFVGIKFGIYGLLWSSICSSFVALYINTYYSGKIFGYSFIDQVKNMFPILVISLITSFSMYLMLMFYTINSLLTQILVTGLLGMIIYITLCKLLYPTPLILLVNYIKKIRND